MSGTLLIDGNRRAASNGRTVDRIDPVTGATATTSSAATVDDANAAVEAAQAAFSAWSATTPEERRAFLLRAADGLEARREQFAKAMLEEAGATGPWAGFNVTLAASMLREAASSTTRITGEIMPSNKPGTLSMAVRQPIGVCVGIAPWNAPIILGTRAVAMPLACGNTVVLKASEQSPETHRLIGESLVDAGLPNGTVNVVTNDPADAGDIVAALVQHRAVRHVNFTGSTRVGRIIAGLAAAELKPALLELGGKAPLLVLHDADIDAAVDAAVFGCFMNQGQICMSTERLVVDDHVADDFAAKLAKRAQGLPAGDPREHVVLGSLVNEQAADLVMELLDDAVARGAEVLAGGGRHGAVVEATVLDRVTPDMRIYAEESFGPVKPIVRVRGDDEAIDVANDSAYGLSSAVFSRDVKRALDVATRIDSGMCHINGPTVMDEAQAPFGGVKSSGFGRFGGTAAIDEFTTLRWVTIEDPNQHYPF